jgi:hypothetical protein
MNGKRSLKDADPGAKWELWHQDTFDWECPRKVETSGRGLTAGLTELWAHTLFETVTVDGKKGFSRFNLWLKQDSKSVRIIGEWQGMVRLRGWIFGENRHARSIVTAAHKGLLKRVATLHGHLTRSGWASESILAAAAVCESRRDFEKHLSRLERDIFEGTGPR